MSETGGFLDLAGQTPSQMMSSRFSKRSCLKKLDGEQWTKILMSACGFHVHMQTHVCMHTHTHACMPTCTHTHKERLT